MYSKHFEDDCFQAYSKLAQSLGAGRVGVLLKKGAILTGFERQSNKRKINLSESTAKRGTTAVEKLRDYGIAHTPL